MCAQIAVPTAADPQLEAWLLDRYVAAQLAGDRRAALQLVVEHGLGRGVPVVGLYLNLIQAAQYRIGDLWQQNRISVAQEHLATAISQVVIAELYRAMTSAAPNGKKAVVASVGGELHDLGTRITADFFEMAGFEVRYLGANVPTDTLVGIIREELPELLIASMTMTFHTDALRDAVLRSREAAGDRLHLAVGGQAFTWAPELIDELGAEVYGRDALESVAGAQRALHLTPA